MIANIPSKNVNINVYVPPFCSSDHEMMNGTDKNKLLSWSVASGCSKYTPLQIENKLYFHESFSKYGIKSSFIIS